LLYYVPKHFKIILFAFVLDVLQYADPETQIRMLCIEGGGVKGVIETVTLEYIHFCLQQLRNGYSSHETKQKLRSFIKEENTENSSVSYDSYGAPKMYKMFDILVGTSMGAIISVALARLHMQPKELREEVVEIARDIFPPSDCWEKPYHFIRIVCAGFKAGKHRYSEKPMEEYLQNKLQEHTWSGKNGDPKFGLVATKADDSTVHVFSSNVYNTSKKVEIWQAIRASTAAPVYFPSAVIEDDLIGETVEFIDGGLAANCPVSYAMQMLEEDDNLAVLVNIGCGENERSKFPIARAFQHARNGEVEWEKFRATQGGYNSLNLHRLAPSITSGLGRYKMSDSSKVEEMQHTYQEWLNSPDSDWYGIEIVKAAANLFAKSLSVLEASVDTTEMDYKLKLKIQVKFDESVHHGQCSIKTSFQSEFSIRIRIGENPVVLDGVYEKRERRECIYLKFEGYDISGSPIKIKKVFCTTSDGRTRKITLGF